MTVTEFVRFFGDFAEIAITVLQIYVICKVAVIVDTLQCRIRDDLQP